MNAIFKTFAKLADVAKLHKSGAKSEPTTCAEEQVNHYRSPKDAVNEGEKTQIHLSGTNNILAYPEFSDVEKAKTLFQTLEKKDTLTNLLSDKAKSENGVQICIGNESGIEEMKDCSIVTTTYKFGNNMTGTIGILGPTRMDYSQVVSVLNGMVKNIENVLDNLDKKGDS